MVLSNNFYYILIGLCLISLLIFIIYVFIKSDNDIDYDKIISDLNKQKEIDLLILDKGNKEINKIENKILKCKKELGIRLFRK